ncbi:MAG: LIC12162 family protein [Gammaproteobacteria bacterium]|nr:LIC12162 family protein [Gammaproteobacteria bacterium]
MNKILNIEQRSFLALTSLDEFWDKSKSILFSGEWCKTNENSENRIGLNIETFTINYSKEETDRIYEYIGYVYENLLELLSAWLNSVHKVSYSLKYWRALIGPFLLDYITLSYNKLDCLTKIYEKYLNIQTIGLAESSYIIPIDSSHFLQNLSVDHIWNLQLFTQLLLSRFPEKYISLKDSTLINSALEVSKKLNVSPLANSKLQKLKKLKHEISIFFINILSKRIILHTQYSLWMNRKKSYILIFLSTFKIFSIYKLHVPRNLKNEDIQIKFSIRNEIAKLSTDDDFVKILLKTLKINMPLIFIELYNEQVIYSRQAFPYHKPLAFTASVNMTSDDTFKFWAAEQAEFGAKIIILQHGGSQWIQSRSNHEVIELGIKDYFLSWGWQDGKNIISAMSVPISGALQFALKKKMQYQSRQILWVGSQPAKHPLYMGIYKSSSEYYYDWQKRFYLKLMYNVSQKITMRLHSLNSEDDYRFYTDEFPALDVVWRNENKSFIGQLTSAKIFVGDNLNTTHCYALAFNIPTILFIDIKAWGGCNEDAMRYFSGLAKVGILHDSPESAANMLNNIYEDPSDWWNRADVQKARREFCSQFASVSNTWFKDYIKILLSVRKKILLENS